MHSIYFIHPIWRDKHIFVIFIYFDDIKIRCFLFVKKRIQYVNTSLSKVFKTTHFFIKYAITSILSPLLIILFKNQLLSLQVLLFSRSWEKTRTLHRYSIDSPCLDTKAPKIPQQNRSERYFPLKKDILRCFDICDYKHYVSKSI